MYELKKRTKCVFYFFLGYPYSRHFQEPRNVCLIVATSIIVVHTFLGRIVVDEEVVVDSPPLHDPGMVDIVFIVVVLGSYSAVCWNIYNDYIYVYMAYTHQPHIVSVLPQKSSILREANYWTCLKDSHCRIPSRKTQETSLHDFEFGIRSHTGPEFGVVWLENDGMPRGSVADKLVG